jgi:hypothetical protein
MSRRPKHYDRPGKRPGPPRVRSNDTGGSITDQRAPEGYRWEHVNDPRPRASHYVGLGNCRCHVVPIIPLNWSLPVETDEPNPRRVRVIEPPYVYGPDDTHAVVEWASSWGETATFEHDGTPCPGDPTMPKLRNVRGLWPLGVTVPPAPMRGRITAVVWPPAPEPPAPPELPEGVWPRGDVLMCECRVCERAMPIECEPEEFDPDMAYCGGSPRCCP